MTSVKKKKDFTDGPLFFKIILFALPIMATGILQILYNMADNIIVGQFSGDEYALAAVGSTSSLTHLIINLLMGISAGAGVVVSQSYGARDYNTLDRAVHTSVTFSIISGIALSLLGIIISRPALLLMGTKAEIIDSATLYMRIICLGIPASAVYNFGASILRSVGDSRTPLIVLSTTGILNVILNMFFVLVLGMTVDGVATATIIAQYLSAAAVITVLIRRKSEAYSLNPKRLKIHLPLLGRILKLGIPAGIQGSLFSLSNVILTSAANTLPITSVSAKTIVGNLDSISYSAMNSYLHAAMTFTGQNYGAKKHKRIYTVALYSLIQVTILGLLIGHLEILFAEPLISLYIDPMDPNKAIIMATSKEFLDFMLRLYFMCGIMETLSGILRGLGRSLSPMLISLCCICGIRILWVIFVFPTDGFNSLKGLFTCYPVSWSICSLILAANLAIAILKIKRTEAREQATPSHSE